MLTDKDVSIIAVACAYALKEKTKQIKKRRRLWCKGWLLKRQTFSHVNLLHELRLEPDDWRNYLRMDGNTYLELSNLVTPLIEPKDTVMRPVITAHDDKMIF